MATTTLGADSARAIPAAAKGKPAAFVLAFQEFRRVEDGDEDADSTEYQAAVNAYEGAVDRLLVGEADTHDEAAFTALAAFNELDIVLGDGCGRLSKEAKAVLSKVSEGLEKLWRFHDKAGARAARAYAKYVGVVDTCDERRWDREARQ